MQFPNEINFVNRNMASVLYNYSYKEGECMYEDESPIQKITYHTLGDNLEIVSVTGTLLVRNISSLKLLCSSDLIESVELHDSGTFNYDSVSNITVDRTRFVNTICITYSDDKLEDKGDHPDLYTFDITLFEEIVNLAVKIKEQI